MIYYLVMIGIGVFSIYFYFPVGDHLLGTVLPQMADLSGLNLFFREP